MAKRSKSSSEKATAKSKAPAATAQKPSGSAKKNPNRGYRTGDKVVYPNQGVAEVTGVVTKKFGDHDAQKFYVLEFKDSGSVMIPTNNMESVGIQKLCSETEIEKLLRELKQPGKSLSKNWRIRYQQNLELMSSGSISETVKVLARLNKFGQTKTMGVKDQELYQRAREFVVSVVVAVKDISDDKAAKLVDAALETNGKA